MTKITGIKEADFDKFIEKLNELDKDAIATQTHHKDGIWYAIIYHKQEGTFPQNNQISSKATPPASKLKPTVAQKKALSKMGYSVEDIESLSKKEAWAIIKEAKG